MNRWVVWVILGVCVFALIFPFLFSGQGPYGGRSSTWYEKHPTETQKELDWCQKEASRHSDGSCVYARNGSVTAMMDAR